MLQPKKKTLNFGNFYAYLLLLLPAFAVYLIFFAIPVGQSVLFSFTDFNGVNMNYEFVGLNNYKVLFTLDKNAMQTFLNTAIFAVVVCTVQNALAIFVAVGLTQKIRTKDFCRTVLFIPSIISCVVVAYLWSYIYGNDGLVNEILRLLNLSDWVRPWLGDSQTALIAVIIAHIWRFIGQCSLLYIASILSIPESLYEAANIDGASAFRVFRKITFPLIAPAMTVNVITSFIGSLRAADIIIAMTQGGPGHATETAGSYILAMMNAGNYGYASAISVVLMMVILILNGFLFKRMTAREVEM